MTSDAVAPLDRNRATDHRDGPIWDPAALNDLLRGGRLICQAFLKSPLRYAKPETRLIGMGDPAPPIILFRTGFAVRTCTVLDGRRSILDLLLPGDVCGLFYGFIQRPVEEVIAATRVAYYTLDAAAFRALLAEPAASLRVLALMGEGRYRVERIAAAIGRSDARARLCTVLLDLYDRLRRRELVVDDKFHLPLTQEALADYLGLTVVHVNRVLRALREEGLLRIERKIVHIIDPDRVRRFVAGLPLPPEMSEPLLPLESGRPTLPAGKADGIKIERARA